MNSKVDTYLRTAKSWQAETAKLRAILLGCGLTEELKWGKPCYAFEGKNIVIIQGFKDYCALLFFKGALLKDPNSILVKTGPNTQLGRQARFSNLLEIRKLVPTLKACIRQAIEVEKAGLKVDINTKLNLPEELQNKLESDPVLKTAFYALTPGRQRAYSYYFSAPKQSKTRKSRIEKCVPRILDGRGMND